MTPTADALKGLVGALPDAIAKLTEFAEMLDDMAETPNADVVRVANRLRAALAAFESRDRLRDDQTLRSIVGSYIPVGPGGKEAQQQFVDDCLRAIEAALFGPATKETP